MHDLSSYLNIIIILLIILITLAIIFICGLIYFYFKNNLKKNKDKLPKSNPNREGFYCHNHPDTHAEGTCMICGYGFCEKCICEHDRLNFCKEHLQVYLDNEWYQVETIKTEPKNPEEALILYDFKDLLWKNEALPSYVVTHYKINMEGDYIESFVTLYVKKEDGYEVTKRLATFKESYNESNHS